MALFSREGHLFLPALGNMLFLHKPVLLSITVVLKLKC